MALAQRQVAFSALPRSELDLRAKFHSENESISGI